MNNDGYDLRLRSWRDQWIKPPPVKWGDHHAGNGRENKARYTTTVTFGLMFDLKR
jgi:hypothetical protein